jgi:ribose-phosphate pyrophosphokinase
LATELARTLSADLVIAEVRTFADGELHVRVPGEMAGEDLVLVDLVLVQTTYPNDKLLELFLLQDALVDAAPGRVTVVVPYFGYGRQDKRFQPGEAISSRAVAKHLELGADALITVDVHNERVMDYFDIPAIDVTGMPALARRFEELGVEMVLAPDENAARHAETVGALMKIPWDYLKKERLDSWTVETEEKALEVKGRHVAIVDDVVWLAPRASYRSKVPRPSSRDASTGSLWVGRRSVSESSVRWLPRTPSRASTVPFRSPPRSPTASKSSASGYTRPTATRRRAAATMRSPRFW